MVRGRNGQYRDRCVAGLGGERESTGGVVDGGRCLESFGRRLEQLVCSGADEGLSEARGSGRRADSRPPARSVGSL